MTEEQKIIYTETDEAPRLATFSLLPIIKAFTDSAGVTVETRDISLAGRILSAFPEYLKEEQRIPDDLAELGALTLERSANIIKLPNISASNPQMHEAIKELQDQGFAIPDYPEDATEGEALEIRSRYDAIKGSAVNPVLREGNSDRRAPISVKNFAKKFPHKMGEWSPDSKTSVAHMDSGDFYESEKSFIAENDGALTITFIGEDETRIVLSEGIKVTKGEVVDAAAMSKKKLCSFFRKEIDSTPDGVLFSLHLKATMMKVSDPIIFGHAVREYYAKALSENEEVLSQLAIDPNNGIGDVYEKIESLSDADKEKIKADLDSCLEKGPDLAMVDSDRGITNLHVPSDVIVDASMPAAIRESGKMWGPDGELHDMKAVIPDRCYARVYQAVIEDCQEHGAFDPTTLGTVPNVGLMAQKAEEYGSHDTTFESPGIGRIEVEMAGVGVVLSHSVEESDIWRLCRVKHAAIENWFNLALERASLTGWPLVFWLDKNRAHDARLIEKIDHFLRTHEGNTPELEILAPEEATKYSLKRMRAGQNTISVTGNVLRDYLTDLFPIMELGTSAKMLSIVPLINGGGLFETGAGGSAPKHVQQFEKEGHLRWDSLGEFLALAASLEHLARVFDNKPAALLATTLDEAIAKFLESNKAPSRKVNEIDNRGSHFYLGLYWAQAMGAQNENLELSERFKKLAADLEREEETITNQLLSAQGVSVDVGGYYSPNRELASNAMRPSTTLNEALSSIYA